MSQSWPSPERFDSKRMCLPSGLQRGCESFLPGGVGQASRFALAVGRGQPQRRGGLVVRQIDLADDVDDALAVGADLRIADALEREQVVDRHRPFAAVGVDGGRQGQEQQAGAELRRCVIVPSFLVKTANPVGVLYSPASRRASPVAQALACAGGTS